MSCINHKHPDFIKLQEETGIPSYLLGIKLSNYMKDNNTDEFPSKEELIKQNEVNFALKAVKIITDNLTKVNNLFKQLKDTEQFWSKLQKDLQIPKEQLELFKNSEGSTIEEKLVDFVSNYSYSVEINTSFRNEIERFQGYERNGRYFIPDFDEGGEPTEITKEQYNEALNDKTPTQHYSNLTVAGGTNYTENEIATPLITPSIKGHAQFATDNGIGWFRSDELTNMYSKHSLEKRKKMWESYKEEGWATDDVKTRRILEVQSDLFQKGRDKENLDKKQGLLNKRRELLENGDNIQVKEENFITKHKGEYHLEVYSKEGGAKYGLADFGYFKTKKEAENFLNGNVNQNQFLQLLNKDNNWVTFFVKSIIQDSAKKGYEKVLFPRLDTIIQIESQSRFKTYEEAEKSMKNEDWYEKDKSLRKILDAALSKPKEEQNLEHILRLKEQIASHQPSLLNTAKFYENDLTNVLKKQGYTPILITDEYGNTWNEVEIKPENNNTILFQEDKSEVKNQEKEFDKEAKIFSSRYINVKSKLKEFKDKYPLLKFIVRESNDSFTIAIDYPNTFNQLENNSNLPENREVNIRLKNLLAKIGITLEEVEESLTINGEKVSGIAYADLFRKVIQYVNGKTDGTMLPEEAAHVFTLLMKKSDPLRNAMIKNIKSLQTYTDVRNNPKYQSKFGDNEDLYVMEAIGQVIMQRMMGIPVAKKEAWVQTWWNNLVNLVKTLLNGGVDAELSSLLKPFDEVKDKMLANETSNLMSLDEFAEENKNKQFQLFQIDNEVNPVENTINKLGEFTIRDGKAYNKEDKEFEFKETDSKANKKLKFDLINQLRAIRGMSYEPITVDANKLESLDKLANQLNDEINTIYGDDVTVITDQLYYDSEAKVVKKADLLLVLPDGSVDIKSLEAINDAKAFGVKVSFYNNLNKDLLAIKRYLNKINVVARSIKIQPIKINRTKVKIKQGVTKSFDLENDSYYLNNGVYYKNGSVTTKQNYELNESDPQAVDTSHDENYKNPVIDNSNIEYSEFTTVNDPTQSTDEEENKKNLALIKTLKYRLSTIEVSKLPYEIKSQAKKRILLTISQLLTKNSYKGLVNTVLADLRNIKKELKDLSPLDLKNSKEFVQFAIGLEFEYDLKEKINNSDLSDEDKKELIHNVDAINYTANNILKSINNLIKVRNIETGASVDTDLASNPNIAGVNELQDVNERNTVIKKSNLDMVLDWVDASIASMRQNAPKNKWIGTFVRLLDKQNDSILDEVFTFIDIETAFKEKLGDRVMELYNSETGNLIKQYNEDYWKNVKLADKKRDWKWFKDNTTKKSNAKELYDEMLAKETERLESLNLADDVLEYKITEFKKLYDLDSDVYRRTAYLNPYTRSLFLNTNEEWYSTQYKNLSVDLKEFYNFWAATMNKAAAILDEKDKIKSNTVPNISKSMVEAAFVDGKFNMEAMFAGLKFTGESKGKMNPITGKIEYGLPKYFIDSLTDSEGNKIADKSTDLYKSLAMFQAMVINYEKKSEIEGQMLALAAGISSEEVLEKVNEKWEATKNNDKNVEVFMDYLNWAIYDVTNKDKDSKIAGSNYSTQKVTTGVKNLSVKASLALNMYSIVANFLGNEYNLFIESAKGIAFTKKTWAASQWLYSNIFDRSEALGFLELLELNKKDDIKKKVNGLSLNSIVKKYDGANALFIQHFTENTTRNRIALAMGLNHTVNEDGKIVRITDTSIQKNLIELGKVTGDKYNLEVSDKELSKFKRKVQHEVGVITGFSSEDDINRMRLGTFSNLLTTYRGWIPKMAAARFGDLKYDSTIDEWSVGRYRTFGMDLYNSKFKTLLPIVLDIIPFISSLRGGKETLENGLRERGKLQFIREMQRNPKLTLEDEQAFLDSYVSNMKANIAELQVVIGLLLVIALAGGFDDDKKKKNKQLIKVLKRSYSELTFFSNPFAFADIIKTPIPGSNYILNAFSLIGDIFKEMYGNVTGNEKMIKEAKPIRRTIKSIPYFSGAINSVEAVFEE